MGLFSREPTQRPQVQQRPDHVNTQGRICSLSYRQLVLQKPVPTVADGTEWVDSKRGQRAEHLPFKHEKKEKGQQPSGSLIINLVKSGRLLNAHPVSVLHSRSCSLSTGMGWSFRLQACSRVMSHNETPHRSDCNLDLVLLRMIPMSQSRNHSKGNNLGSLAERRSKFRSWRTAKSVSLRGRRHSFVDRK